MEVSMKSIIFAALLQPISGTLAHSLTAEDVKNLCQSENDLRVHQCFGYLQGILEGSSHGSAKTLFHLYENASSMTVEEYTALYGEITGVCPDKNSRALEFIEIINAHIESDFYKPTLDGSFFVMSAFARRFPCK